ncbi:hypothetical protein ABW16_00790 [Mycolicibacter heraklionensis]|uniref:Uncharacterized protein n=1 Tax=Mycolicibacter heraklionensis TaxID=512402 RepID=A0ABR5FKB9_9MYCO|nr:hypothetical protein ABW16_00790 [Mycolicibacter heraklionensis]
MNEIAPLTSGTRSQTLANRTQTIERRVRTSVREQLRSASGSDYNASTTERTVSKPRLGGRTLKSGARWPSPGEI